MPHANTTSPYQLPLTFSNCIGTADALGPHTDLQHTLTNSVPFNVPYLFPLFLLHLVTQWLLTC